MPYSLVGVALIVVWGIATVATQAPGWVHVLLSAGLALLVYGIVKPGAAAKK